MEKISFEEELRRHGSFLFPSTGWSMSPLIKPGRDLVEITKRPPQRLRRYDVVLYKRDGKYILHRILEVLPDGKYIIAGDNNTFLEKDITDDLILGVMTRVIREGRSINVDDPSYQRYVHLWCDAYPVRMGILKVRRKAILGLSKVKGLFG